MPSLSAPNLKFFWKKSWKLSGPDQLSLCSRFFVDTFNVLPLEPVISVISWICSSITWAANGTAAAAHVESLPENRLVLRRYEILARCQTSLLRYMYLTQIRKT